MHNLFGIVVYLGMGAGVALVSLAPGLSGLKLRRAFMLLTGAAFPVVFAVMVQPEVAPWRGVLQRLLDVAMAISLLLIVQTLVRPQPTGGA